MLAAVVKYMEIPRQIELMLYRDSVDIEIEQPDGCEAALPKCCLYAFTSSRISLRIPFAMIAKLVLANMRMPDLHSFSIVVLADLVCGVIAYIFSACDPSAHFRH